MSSEAARRNQPPSTARAPTVTLSAGGLLWRERADRSELVVVHRPEYDDWTLPKGTVESGESLLDAAVREVTEETDCRVETTPPEFAGCVSFPVDDSIEVVAFWHMTLLEERPFQSTGETDERRWVTVDEAVALLTYPEQRDLLRRAANGAEPDHSAPGDASRWGAMLGGPRRLWRRFVTHPAFYRSRSNARLVDELTVYRAVVDEFARRLQGDGAADETWVPVTYRLLDEAQRAVDENQVERGWQCLSAARRLRVFGLAAYSADALAAEARVTRRVANAKLGSWRRASVNDLLSPWPRHATTSQAGTQAGTEESDGENGDALDIDDRAMRLYRAKEILDGEFSNRAIKQREFRRQLQLLIAIATVTLAVFLVVHVEYGPVIGASVVTDSVAFTVAVVTFGVLGATINGFLRTIRASADVRIPDQYRSNLVTLSRTAIGGVSALVGLAFLQSGILQLGDPTAGLTLAVAFVAGFSEGLIERAAAQLSG